MEQAMLHREIRQYLMVDIWTGFNADIDVAIPGTTASDRLLKVFTTNILCCALSEEYCQLCVCDFKAS